MTDIMHIGLSYQEDVPEEIISEFADAISVDGLVLKHEARPIAQYAAMEWVVPSVIVAYLARPYFESFLKEAGKERYHLMKSGFIRLFRTIFGKKPECRPSGRSLIFSIQTQTKDGSSVKFIFPEGVSLEEYGILLDSLFDLISDHYGDTPSDDLSKIVSLSEMPSRSIYLEYSISSKSWVLLDPLAEVRNAKKKREGQKSMGSESIDFGEDINRV